MVRFALVLSLFSGVWAGTHCSALAQDKKAGEKVTLDLETARLSTPIEIGNAKYTRVRVVGTLMDETGDGELRLDPNERVLFNEFGDIVGGTRLAVVSIKVKISRLRILDPTGLGRILYSVSGDKLPTLKVVVPASPKESYRLLVGDEKDIKHVLTLEERIKKDEKKDGVAPLAKYRAEQGNKKVIVFAEGKNPTSGWKNELEVLPIDIYPPEFKFTQTKPTGVVTQVLTPFAVEKSADAPTKIEFVFVTDTAGKHKVPVTQSK